MSVQRRRGISLEKFQPNFLKMDSTLTIGPASKFINERT